MRGNTYAGYVTGDTVTTFAGDHIADITGLSYSRRIWTGDHYYRRMHVQAVTEDGARWYARGTDSYNLITLRRAKR